MSRSPRRLAVLLALAGVASAAWADPTIPPNANITVEDLVFPIEDIVPATESMDGSETESKKGDKVTVALTSDVLFALDKWVLTPKAKQRLRQVAAKVKAESSGGVVKIEGHTDDQGDDPYNLRLSQRRAQAVRQAMQGMLSGVSFETKGFGESRPTVPNSEDGKPIEKNRAKNRRVEIVFTSL